MGRPLALPVPRDERATGRRAIRCWPASSPISDRRPDAVAFGGRGEFDGVMTGPFRRPRVEGDLAARTCAPGTRSGATARPHRRREQLRDGQRQHRPARRIRRSAPTASSRWAIRGEDGGEEIDARFRVTRRDLDSLRHAFQIDEYPVSGLLSRRVPPHRSVRAAARVRRHDDRRRRRVRRAVREGDRVAALRRRRRPAGRHRASRRTPAR